MQLGTQQQQNLFEINEEVMEENNNFIGNQTLSECDYQLVCNPALSQRTQKFEAALRKTQIRRQSYLERNLKSKEKIEIFSDPTQIDFIQRKLTHKQTSINILENQIQSKIDSHEQNSLLYSNEQRDNQQQQSSPIFKKQNELKESIAKTNSICKYMNITQFIRQLQRHLKPSYSFQEKHFCIINDKGAGAIKEFLSQKPKLSFLTHQIVNTQLSIQTLLKRQMKKYIISFANNAISMYYNIPLIYPNNNLKILWDIIVSFIRLFLIIFIPLELAFNNLLTQIQNILLMASLFLIVDFLLKLITVYFELGLPVIDRKLILQNQFKFINLIGLISVIILLVFSLKNEDFLVQFSLYGGWPKLFLLLFFVHLRDLARLVRQIQESLNFSKTTGSLIELGNLISIVMLVQHIFSCIWFCVGYMQEQKNQPNWLKDQDLLENGKQQQYLESLYFTSVTMFTVGYGDITPQSLNSYQIIFLDTIEKIICITFMMIF